MKSKVKGFVLTAMALLFVQSAWAFYNPSIGRWLSRDPIGERGGKNLYGYVRNEAVNRTDYLGLRPPYPGPTDTHPLPPPNPVPPPILDEDDKLPEGYTGFSICQRPLNETDCIDRLLNKCGQGHKFVMYTGSDGKKDGYGFYPNGKINQEQNLNCPRAVTCKKAKRRLQYGNAAGTEGTSATDAQILDCIKSRPTLGPYGPPFNDCRHWVGPATSDCGLDCGS